MDTVNYYTNNVLVAKEGGNPLSIGSAFLEAVSVPIVYIRMDEGLKEDCIQGILDENNIHQVKRLKAILDKYAEPREDVTALNEQNSDDPDAVATFNMIIREIERANDNCHYAAVEHLLVRNLSLPRFVEMISQDLVQECFDKALTYGQPHLSRKIWNAAESAGLELHPRNSGLFAAPGAEQAPK